MNLFKWFGQTMEEAPGVPSSIRLQMFLCYLIAGFLPLVIWAILSYQQKKLIDFPPTLATYCSALILGSTGAKVWQYGKEPEIAKS